MKPLEKKEELKKKFEKRKAERKGEIKDFRSLDLDILPETFEYFRKHRL